MSATVSSLVTLEVNVKWFCLLLFSIELRIAYTPQVCCINVDNVKAI